MAVELSSQCDPGARVLLVLPAGLQFIVAFFGCLYAGLIAIPICPPNPNRPLTTLSAIIKDCRAGLALITDRDLRIIRLQPHDPVLPAVRWWIVDNEKQPDRADEWNEPDIDSTSIALLQYTSGATATPKGVAITHGNLLHNFKAIEDRFACGPTIRAVNWLPPYHDMGLIGGILQPMYLKTPMTLMPPMTVLMRPA